MKEVKIEVLRKDRTGFKGEDGNWYRVFEKELQDKLAKGKTAKIDNNKVIDIVGEAYTPNKSKKDSKVVSRLALLNTSVSILDAQGEMNFDVSDVIDIAKELEKWVYEQTS